jgi:hypothetical protein
MYPTNTPITIILICTYLYQMKDLAFTQALAKIIAINLSWYKMPRFNLRKNMREAMQGDTYILQS